MRTENISAIKNEIAAWEKKLLKPNILSKAGAIIGKPVEWGFNHLPNTVVQTVGKSIEGIFGLLIFTSDYTFSDKAIIKKVVKNGGYNVSNIELLINQNIYVLKKSAASYISKNNIIAALEGFSCGFGGISLVAADIPLIFGIAFRVVQQIGATFGHDMTMPEEKRFIMNIIDLGSCLPTAAKFESMLGKEALKTYVKNVTFKKMEQTAAVKLGKKTAEEIAKEILHAQGKRATKAAIEKVATQVSEDVAKDGTKAVLITQAKKTAKEVGGELTKKKFLQLIPVLGGVVGAGFNFWFIWSIGETAYYAYLKRFIAEHYETQ